MKWIYQDDLRGCGKLETEEHVLFEHTKGQDAQQLQALARRHSMQNHSKK